jgi:rRNA maturation endonuclease Nob1
MMNEEVNGSTEAELVANLKSMLPEGEDFKICSKCGSKAIRVRRDLKEKKNG